MAELEPNSADREQGYAIEHRVGDDAPARLAVIDRNLTVGESKARWIRMIPNHIETLHYHARQSLPPGTVYEIRLLVPTNYGMNLGVAWYHLPEMKDWPLMELVPYPGELNALCGYYLMGRLKTPT